MSAAAFPIDPLRFVALPNPTRNRILLVSDVNEPSPSARQVATVPTDVDVYELVAALNAAAWSGDRRTFDTFQEELPEPVWHACQQALETVPTHTSVVVGDREVPLAVMVDFATRPEDDDLDEFAEATLTVGAQLMITNELHDKELFVNVAVLTGEPDFETGFHGSWWPLPSGARVAERKVTQPGLLSSEINDPRWRTHAVRAYTAWEPDPERTDTRTSCLVVEYLDALLSTEHDDRFDAEEPGESTALTVRNRFVLWHALWMIASDLDMTVASEPFDPEMSMVVDDMPQMTRAQPKRWWQFMAESANQLCDAARTGDDSRLIPRTPAEEALIYLATTPGYVDAARDHIVENGFQHRFEELPLSEDDGDFREILPELAGDTDIEQMWLPHRDGIEHPDSTINQILGIGDYRPGAWHTPFDGRA